MLGVVTRQKKASARRQRYLQKLHKRTKTRMKNKENRHSNIEIASIAPRQNKGNSRGIVRVSERISRKNLPEMKTFGLYLSGLLAIGIFTFVPLSIAHGSSAGQMAAMGGRGNMDLHGHGRYSDPFWEPYHPGLYDSVYSYRPTPKQQATAKQQVEAYLLAVKKRRKYAATHRYIAVETLRPTKQQIDDYTKKDQSAGSVEPAQLRCLMVFDTQTREFVGSGCYIVGSEPAVGEVTRFESVSAEFVGHEAP